uniref:Uncharacterized protein n=1 Tax=Oryza rufipogon TaxID=4529 RepID=A0A0E0MTR8_ORYRU
MAGGGLSSGGGRAAEAAAAATGPLKQQWQRDGRRCTARFVDDFVNDLWIVDDIVDGQL